MLWDRGYRVGYLLSDFCTFRALAVDFVEEKSDPVVHLFVLLGSYFLVSG